jgi:hypothetical protein
MSYFYIKGPPEKALKAFVCDFKYPEILLILSKQKDDSWPLLGAFPHTTSFTGGADSIFIFVNELPRRRAAGYL